MKKKIENYISLINSSGSAPEAFQSFIKIMDDYGYDKVAYGFATDHPSIGLKKTHGHFNNFPDDWMKHYTGKEYATIDPVPAQMLKSPRPLFWSEFENDQSVSDASKKMMREASDAGLKEGAMVPLYSPFGEIAGISVSSGESGREGNYEDLAAITLLSIYFHESYKSFIKKENVTKPLSEKEYDILSWAAEGKTDAEIAIIVGKSIATVRYHWKNIFKKLNAYGRVYAISRAIQARIVTPGSIKNVQ